MRDETAAVELPTVEVRLQPIVALDGSHRVVAAEALSRLAGEAPVLELLEDAGRRGCRDDVEAHLLRGALAARHRVPAGVLLSLNVSPAALSGGAALAVLDALPSLDGLVLELRLDRAEGEEGALLESLERLRGRGARLALDDDGDGFHSLFAIGRLRPEWLKVDRSVVTGAKDDPVRRASLAMFAQCAQRCGSVLVAEGVESEDDLAALRELDVSYAQGFWFSAAVAGPVPLQVVPGS